MLELVTKTFVGQELYLQTVYWLICRLLMALMRTSKQRWNITKVGIFLCSSVTIAVDVVIVVVVVVVVHVAAASVLVLVFLLYRSRLCRCC